MNEKTNLQYNIDLVGSLVIAFLAGGVVFIMVFIFGATFYSEKSSVELEKYFYTSANKKLITEDDCVEGTKKPPELIEGTWFPGECVSKQFKDGAR